MSVFSTSVYCSNCGSKRIKLLKKKPISRLVLRFDIDLDRPILQCQNTSCRFNWNATEQQLEMFIIEGLHRFCGCRKHLKLWNIVRGYVEA